MFDPVSWLALPVQILACVAVVWVYNWLG